jgi:hypothetical protein
LKHLSWHQIGSKKSRDAAAKDIEEAAKEHHTEVHVSIFHVG